MSVFAQTGGGDWDLTSKQLKIVRDNASSDAQSLFNKFRTFLGEWFLDTRLGIPYFQTVFVKNPDLGVIRQVFRKVLLSAPSVVSVESMDLGLDAKRQLTFSFRVLTDSGVTISGGLGVPFIVGG